MPIRLWPKEFERKDHISKAEKALLRNAQANFKDGHLAVSIDPIGLSTDNVKMCLYLSPSEGLITISLFSTPFDEKQTDTYVKYVEMVEEAVYERLLDSKILIVRNGKYKALKFPYKHIIMFSNDKKITVSEQNLKKLEGYVTANFFLPLNFSTEKKYLSDLQIFSNIRKPFDPEFRMISELESRAVFERLAPEYTVVVHELENVNIKERTNIPTTADSLTITGDELEYKTFFLDEYQVSLVNDMGTGHRVILANPGSGKSVLLLSKAFKYASTYKDSKVLLTCYNNNLADSYNFKKSCANFGANDNLFIMTFHKLVRKIYLECLHQSCESNIATDEEIQACINEIKKGKVDLKFTAIFIDEVQIFDPLYLELCYLLLDNENPNSIFLMAGDLNQTVRTQSRRGDAPWKKINGVNLDFTGRVRYIEKNYRNSKIIGEYLNHMLRLMNDRLDMLKMINLKEFEYDSFEVGDKQSLALEVRTGIDRFKIKDSVINAIHEIVTKYKVNYSEIAILFPYQQQKLLKYYIKFWIEKSLEEAGIPYSLIISSPSNNYQKTRYSDTEGIILSTIDSSLGLDFKAVILAGLHPYDYVITNDYKKTMISSWKKVSAMGDEEKELLQTQMRKLYTACSRAREILYVLSDLKPKTPMEELLLTPMEELRRMQRRK